ncbi:hypothetical protein BASA81_011117 [Batrachochytrium salamandrivorans]|nr:hypothetical protein BASA81_011117 [Batrachochytrium salamandrivorans]
MAWLLLLLLLVQLGVAARPKETYSESLLVRKTSPTSLGFRFEFVHRKLDHSQRYETFPKLVDQMVAGNVSEVRLVLTRGTWRWGSETLWPSIESGSPGVELWAQTANPELDWAGLIRPLSGLTCASLDVLDYSRVGKPTNHTVFAHLPSETVCVENLAPFLKLLPCRAEAGLGQMISPKRVVSESLYYAMAITIRRGDKGIELIQSLSIVLPAKPHLFNLFPNWNRMASCGLGNSELVLEHDRTVFALPHAESNSVRLDRLPVHVPRHHLQVTKWQTESSGSLHGKMSVHIECESRLPVLHWEFLPHFIQPRMKTLQVRANGALVPDVRRVVEFVSNDGLGSPGFLIFSLVCERDLTITYEFDKLFLYYGQYPPNPNRGFDVPSSITQFNTSTATAVKVPAIWQRSHAGPVRVSSEALLVYLAHPDFSMPYNVITLSSTAFAMFLGMLVNISVRKRGDLWTRKPAPGLLVRLRTWLVDRFARRK